MRCLVPGKKAGKGYFASFKHPKAVVVAELPRNAMDKVQKNLLRAEYGGWFGGGGMGGNWHVILLYCGQNPNTD